MSKNNHEPIIFDAIKVHVHHWPLSSPHWAQSIKEKVDLDLNKNKEKKKITINDDQVKINEYEFEKIKKVGVTVPLFKKEATVVFEGIFLDSAAHVHITTSSQNYLEIFNKIMSWKNQYFSN